MTRMKKCLMGLACVLLMVLLPSIVMAADYTMTGYDPLYFWTDKENLTIDYTPHASGRIDLYSSEVKTMRMCDDTGETVTGVYDEQMGNCRIETVVTKGKTYTLELELTGGLEYVSLYTMGAYPYIRRGDTLTLLSDECWDDSDFDYNLKDGVKKLVFAPGMTRIEESAFSGWEEITSVTLPDTMTTIGSSSFLDCKNLTKISIPDSVTNVGGSVFENCTKLSSVRWSKNAPIIGINCFRRCTSLSAMTIPEGVENIGDQAFSDSSIQEVIIPSTVSRIGSSAFWGTKLTSVVIPGSVTEVESFAFAQCSALTEVTLRKGVRWLGQYAFDGAAVLKKVSLPSTLEDIEQGVFSNCPALTEITVPSTNLNYCVSGGILFDKAKKVLLVYPRTSETGSYKVPGTVAEIWYDAFAYTNLSSLELPASLRKIRGSSLTNMRNVKELVIPEGVTLIESQAIFSDGKLEKIVLPGTLKSMHSMNGQGCQNLREVLYLGTKTQWGKVAVDMGNDSIVSKLVFLSAPSISALSNLKDGLKVTWKSVPYVKKYRVYHRVKGASSWTVDETVSTLNYTIPKSKLTGGKTYEVAVACVNTDGSKVISSKSATKSLVRLSTVTPTLSNLSDSIKVTWTKVAGAEGYYIYRKTSGGSYSKIATITDPATLQYKDTGRTNGTGYYYYVKSFKGSTVSSYSSKYILRLSRPTVTLTNPLAGKLTATWKANTKCQGYEIQVATNSSFTTGLKTYKFTKNTSVTKSVTGLTKGKTYYVRVRAYKTNSDGSVTYRSAYSSVKSLKLTK